MENAGSKEKVLANKQEKRTSGCSCFYILFKKIHQNEAPSSSLMPQSIHFANMLCIVEMSHKHRLHDNIN